MKVRERVRILPSGTKKVLWECDLGKINGKRLAPCFRAKKDAEDRLKLEKEKLKQFGHVAYSLSEADRHRFASARDRLALVGATIETAVDFYLAEHRPLAEPVTMPDLLARCVLAKELQGRRDRYLSQFAVSCGSFVAGRESRFAHEVTREEIERWIFGNGWAPKTQKGYLGDLRALFSWAVEKRYIARNPASGKIELPEAELAEIEALSVSQAKALLILSAQIPAGLLAGRRRGWDRPPLLWYVVLGLFCGIRPDELARMDRSKVDLVDRHVVVTAKSSKTRQRRVVDLTENAVAWLSLDALRDGPVRPKNFRLLWGRLRWQAGFLERNHSRAKKPIDDGSERVPWPHDAMRHTFASMHYAHHQDEGLLKAQMGHSEDEDTLMQHYRALKTRREAEEFWGLNPAIRGAAECE